MFIAAAIVVGLLASALVASGAAKLMKNPQLVEGMASVGVPEHRLWLLASAEIAGAIGLVAGLFWWPIGVAAAIGVILYFVGALGAHLRVRDTGFAPALALLLVGAAALGLRLATT
ncbi:MAG: hypothetical protein QOD98_3772 [Nocardioidaceae bacterium]|jgi:uncharacterized membrane protein YphA (DoxX/SURF4 family)|nr:hypothetical protein [Nocardioidaceae bacterium]